VEDFLAQEYADNRVMLIQGGAGAGKTLFGRALERRLWQTLDTTLFIPVFISLPRAADPYSNLVEHALNDLGTLFFLFFVFCFVLFFCFLSASLIICLFYSLLSRSTSF
jgi:hypothetical protein